MNKQEIDAYLNTLEISYELGEHKAVFNMTELKDVELPYPEADTKKLFVYDDKKRQHFCG